MTFMKNFSKMLIIIVLYTHLTPFTQRYNNHVQHSWLALHVLETYPNIKRGITVLYQQPPRNVT
jgi:hypothetical protein